MSGTLLKKGTEDKRKAAGAVSRSAHPIRGMITSMFDPSWGRA